MAALDNIASELLKSANEADLIYKRTRDQAQRDKAVRLRRIVENLKAISAGGLTPTLDQVLTVGNTSTNTLNVGGITTDYVQLDTAATPTLQPGMFAWNDQDGTADLRLKGGNVTLQVGQETLARVVNKTGADLLESQYKVVRVRIASEGGSQGQRLAVVLAQGNNDPDSVTTLGLVTENIANNQEGFITIFGNVNGINTTGSLQGETWVDGDVLFLSPTTPGALTKVKPVAPNHTVVVGYVLYAHGVNGKIFVKVDNGYEIDELHNVKITSVANNDLLQYDSTQQVWKNVPVATAVPTPTLAAVTTAGNTTTNAITVGGLTVATNLIYTDTVNSRVGIGTNSPAVTLHVQNGGSTPKALFQHGTLAHLGVIIGSTGGGFTVEDNNFFAIWHQDYANRSNETGLTERMRITTGGNILIGTTTDAGYKLDVNGTFKTTSFWTTSSGRAQWGNSLTAYGTLTWDTGYARIHATSGNRLDLGASEGLHMTISTAGNIGIGTTSPAQKFDVNGIAKFRSATYFGQISQPSAPTLGTNSTTGGTLPADTYTYRISALDFWGVETTPSNALNVTTTGSTSSVSMSWPLVQGAYSYRIYRINSGGTIMYFVNSGTNSTSFTDTGAAGTVGVTTGVNNTAYGYYNTNGDLRTGNILIVNNGVGNTSSIIFDKSTDGPQINVVEYANDSTLFEFALRDNPDGPDAFHFVMPDWQNPSTGWKPFKFAAFTTQIVGQNTNFWSSFSLPSSTPYYTTNPESLANSQIKWDPYTSTSYNVPKDSGTGTGVFNVDVTGFTLTTHKNYWVIIEAGATTFKWGLDWYAGTPSATGVAITGGWQTLSSGVQVKITGAVVANDRWSFRAFPVPKMGIGTTAPIAPLQVSTTIRPTSAVARGVYFNPTLVATANNDLLVGLDVAPTFTAGAFTGVLSLAARFSGRVHLSYSSLTFSGSAGNSADLQLTTNGFVAWNQNFNISGSSATNYLTLFNTTGNLLLQNGGTFTDAGYRLDVNGTARVQSNFTVDTDTLYVDATNNRVGIGTTTPTDKLHIIDSNNANIFGRITATGTNASAAWVAMNNQNDNVVYRVFGDGVSGSQMGISLVRSASLMANLGGSGKFLVGTFSSTDFVLGTGNTERARFVDSTGNFLIGTTSDNGNRLQVSGTIDGQAFAVNGVNGWTGTIVIIGNPPGQQNIQVDSGIITNVF